MKKNKKQNMKVVKINENSRKKISVIRDFTVFTGSNDELDKFPRTCKE